MTKRLTSSPSRTATRWLLAVLPGMILVALAGWGSYEAHNDSKCDMSFMRPVFIRLNFTTPTEEQARANRSTPFVSGFAYKYRLFRYMDGYGEHSNYLGGFPVLFLPGNRGSYQQARSVGSALGFMSGKLAVADVFTVDFEEEATAGFGDLFWEQATFVNDAVVTIRSLYEKEFASSNVNVTVIGHSMGGLVARAVPMLKRYVPGSISNVITLSSPHQRLPLPFDATLVSSLKSVNDFWKIAMEKPAESKPKSFRAADKVKSVVAAKVDTEPSDATEIDASGGAINITGESLSSDSNGSSIIVDVPVPVTTANTTHPYDILKGTSLFSITGGLRDLQVASSATSVQGLVPYWKWAWLSTEDVHVCMCAADHLSILWCRQFVDELAKAIISVAVQCGGIEYDDTQRSHVGWIKPIPSCTAPGRVKYMRSLLAAPVGYVDGEAEFWHPAVDVAVTVASSVGETAPFALTTMLFVVSTLVFIRLVLHLREADSHTSALAAIASCVLPWNHLPLLAWPFVLCAMPLKVLLRWYVRALRSSGTLVDATLSQRLSPQSVWAGLCKSIRVSAAILVGAKLSLAFLSAYLQSSVLPAGVSSCVAWLSGMVNATCVLITNSIGTVLRYSVIPSAFSWPTLAVMYLLSVCILTGLSTAMIFVSKAFACCIRLRPVSDAPSSCRTPAVVVVVLVSLAGAGSYSFTRSLSVALASMAVANLSLIAAGILRAIVIPNSHFQSASPLHVLLCCVVLSSFGATIGLLRQVYVIFSRYATDDGSQTFYTASARESLLFNFNGVLLPIAVLLLWFPRDVALPGVLVSTGKFPLSVLHLTLEWVSWKGAKFVAGFAQPHDRVDPAANKRAVVGTVAHATCKICLHEDGGPQALYEETDGIGVVVISKMVQIGPTFRVVACNCAFVCERTGDMCEFCLCKCKACGGSQYRRPVSRGVFPMEDSSESEGEEAAVPILGRANPRETPPALALLTRVRQWLLLLLCAIVTVTVVCLMDLPHLMPVAVAIVCTVVLGSCWQK